MISKRGKPANIHLQAGITLVEALIGLALSLIVTTSMIALMGNSVGSAKRIIQMSQLSDELRNAASMMSRDVRRANYNPNSIYCYGNSDCATDGSATQAPDIYIDTSDNGCFTFNLDRNWDGESDSDNAGGFRRVLVNSERAGGDVGVIEMWVGDQDPQCGDGPGGDWIPVTDPGFVDVTFFRVENDGFSGTVGSGTGTLTQGIRVIDLSVRGELILDRRIHKELRDRIRVRNDFLM